MAVEMRPILEHRLEEAILQEMEELSCREDIRTEKWFRDITALLVILCYVGESGTSEKERHNEEFIDFYRRIVAVFNKVTEENAESDPDIKRPTFREATIDSKNKISWKFIKRVSTGSYIFGFCDAIMHLMLSDANNSFLQFLSRNHHSAVEVPCFYEIFRCSSKNNQHSMALFGEYVALISICFFNKYFADRSSYKPETEKFDFSVRESVNGVEKIVNFSVKSVNLQGVQLFSASESKDKWSPSDEIGSVSEREGVNILLHNCSCSICLASAVREVKVKMELGDPQQKVRTKTVTGLDEGCECKEKFKCILMKYEPNSVVHLVSAELSFELRHALLIFDQKKFRGTKKSFRLRNHIYDLLEELGDQVDADPEEWLKTLIDKTKAVDSSV